MSTILIADHHPITRVGITSLLSENDDLEVLDNVTSGQELFKYLKNNELPDVLVIELDLPEINGINALRTIKSQFPGTKMLIFSCHPEEMYAISAIKAGASGYLAKTVSTDILQQAIQQVARGGIYLNKNITDRINSGVNQNNGLISKFKKLSTREAEVLNMLATGKRNKEIAEVLDINEKTVSTYKTRLLKKLKVDNLADLIHQTRLLQLHTT
ncbi:response regulator transcription factor [Antarcticibacterium flavum]|uniref:Response regulator transcription factor n=1 Tax=Antarcticibacterium flavum TaxID=2058175 RepID=A0A5B7X2H4_9FLAO|nr:MULTISPECIES: response regulator transcription factor [Antarcticibacterium]MCM4159860.1 DNA-binding response regulator [Antarcticibacterium sp. W02-3]QCY68861.1 response regulator transcription factor [Antarcticibacterium flavum]